ncbi:hypothetical protein FIBSPDRAFT_941872 [Athelia psychrophila]|uniref:Uncharacterized protein n=1 Tax=Athelia psychrophila TaxID=1759441 RepID=A0A167TAZ0_9AGAM|nr:hypothetical protein FIBSPDRAFT_941872 [Fibularhizoctonia sp. CBS 109695]
MYLPRAAGRGKRPAFGKRAAFPYHVLQLQRALVQRAAMTIGPRCRALRGRWKATSMLHFHSAETKNDVKNIVAASRYIQEAFQQTRVGTATECKSYIERSFDWYYSDPLLNSGKVGYCNDIFRAAQQPVILKSRARCQQQRARMFAVTRNGSDSRDNAK